MKFSSIMQVPNTRDAKLLNMLVELEPEMATISGYHVKMTESSGVPLSRLFQRTPYRLRCHWEACPACEVPDSSGKEKKTRCKNSNIVYKGTCVKCEEEVARGEKCTKDIGTYISESSRTLSERALEHVMGSKSKINLL